ncbi:MAG: glycosyl hydrolase family 28-related protein [Polyangiales bacterium]
MFVSALVGCGDASIASGGDAATDAATDAAIEADSTARPDASPTDALSIADALTPDLSTTTDAATLATRGATLPYVEYEAEDAVTNGTVIGPSRAFGDLAAEASGRRAVRLDSTGQHVTITASSVANSIVVRFVIPDAPTGGGLQATLSLYVNGVFRQKLALTSKYAWTYGAFGSAQANDPTQGNPHHYFDEARAIGLEIPVGSTVTLQRDADDTAAYYVVDLIDLEQVAAALSQPPNTLSLTDCGAIPDDSADDSDAIQACVAQAQSQHKGLFIPPGTFTSLAHAIDVADVTVRGAGMWYSTISGFNARFNCTGDNCVYYDFAISGDTVLRDDASPESGFSGGAGTGSRLENIWVEHTKTGYWVSASGHVTDGLVIHGCRFRDLYADGVNFCNGTKNSVVEQSHARNTGDDAFASWSPIADGVNTNNVFRFNTVQLPWLANCYAIYGGQDNTIADSICADVVQYPGVLVAQEFTSHPFAGITTVQRVTLLRAGGPAYGAQQGALKLFAPDAAMTGFLFADLDLVSPTFSGIQVQGSHRIDGVVMQRITIDRPGTVGLQLDSDASGAGAVDDLVVTSPASAGLEDDAHGAFVITRGAGNSGW